MATPNGTDTMANCDANRPNDAEQKLMTVSADMNADATEISKNNHRDVDTLDTKHDQPSKRQKTKHEKKQRFVTPAPEYAFAHGYRMVKPYIYEFRTYAKERWFKKPLLEIFTKEFGAYPPEYYELAIRSGRITVNRTVVSPNLIIKNGDLIIHKTHRHEPPVNGDQIAMVHEDDDVLVVCKPPSIPTHPCGAYRHNSLHSIVQQMRPELGQLHIVHRLDRLTSGLVILAKHAAKAKALSQCIADRDASKTYVARVRGHLVLSKDQEAQLKATAQQNCDAAVITLEESDGNDGLVLRISCPLRCLSAKDGVWQCHGDGKPSETLVRILRSIDSETTLVECKPVTGRTHQIRLHLQLIGFPIANDPCYGGELHYGESQEQLDRIAHAKARQAQDQADRNSVTIDQLATPQQPEETEEQFMARTCSWCRIGEAEAFNETQLHCSKIWLHALEYKLDGHVFCTQMPSWAS